MSLYLFIRRINALIGEVTEETTVEDLSKSLLALIEEAKETEPQPTE